MKKINIAITGASGAIYARQLVERLIKQPEVESLRIIFTQNGIQVMNSEQSDEWNRVLECDDSYKIDIVQNDDFYVSLASGSGRDDALIIVPCSVGMMSRIACGVSDDLITRGADVMLKERRKLILVVRESPFNLIHLRNMTQLTEAGAIVMAASPSFYSNPLSIEELCETTVNNILRLIGFETPYHWCENSNEYAK